MSWGNRFGRKDVECRNRNMTLAQRSDQRRRVDEIAARDVDEDNASLHLRERLAINQAARGRSRRAVQRDNVGRREQLVQRA